MEEEGTQVPVVRCISLVSSEHRIGNFFQKGSMCTYIRGMVGLGDEPW